MKPKRRLKRNTLNFLIDAAAAFAFLGLLFTGYIVRFVLPPGTGRGYLLWGTDRHGWGDFHTWFGYAMLGLIIIHLALHWKWITGTLRSFLKRSKEHSQTALRSLGALALLLLLAFGTLLYAAHQSVLPAESGNSPDHHGQPKHLRMGQSRSHMTP